MHAYCHLFRISLIGLLILGTFGEITSTSAQSTTSEETARSIRRRLERLPYYGVFDFIVFRVNGGTVALAGYSFQGSLKKDAEAAAKRVTGVVEVLNRIEVLPASIEDDRIRWETFYRIYTDSFLSRYAPGGEFEVLREIEDERRFPGMQPVGIYPIHIVVKSGRTMLFGVVDTAADRQIAELRAREVIGVFGVENSLVVDGGRQEGASK